MRLNIRRTAVALIAVAVLGVGIFLPSFAFWIQDRGISEQVFREELQRTAEKGSLHICHLLRMAFLTEKQIILSSGRYFSPEEAYAQAKLSLKTLESLEFLSLDWEGCTLRDYAIVFRISSEDLSRRMILWSLTIETGDGAVIQISLDDKTGVILGFRYSNPENPFYTTQIPPSESQIDGQKLIDFFADYWNVSVTGNSVVSNSGGHMLTVSEVEQGLSAEIPFNLDPTGFSINFSNQLMQK